MISRAIIELSTILDNTPWLVNLPRRLILDQKVQCLVTTEFIYLYLFESIFLSPLSLALITLITCFVLNIRHLNKIKEAKSVDKSTHTMRSGVDQGELRQAKARQSKSKRKAHT